MPVEVVQERASVLETNGKYYPHEYYQFFLHKCYKNNSISYKNVTVRKIDISEGIDTNKTSLSKECMLYHYWCFIDVGFKFEPHV